MGGSNQKFPGVLAVEGVDCRTPENTSARAFTSGSVWEP